MRRREFIKMLGGAASLPFAAHAQQTAMPVIGFLHSGSPEPNAKRVAAFRKGLGESGYVEGQNVAIEFRWAMGQDSGLPELAADLVRRQVSVIATPISTAATMAARSVTTTVPIIFAVGGDPVAMGLVASLSRPGANATGISILNVELMAKRLALLRELAAHTARFAALVNPRSGLTEAIVKNVQAGAPALGLPLEILSASTDQEIEAVVASLARQLGGALLVPPDEFFFDRRAQLVALAARHAVPAIYSAREYADIGGLMSYGTDPVYVYQQTGNYAGRILKGEKPADLPVLQPAKFELVINLKTARSLGLAVPQSLQVAADEVIE